jgi:hypothetical protein
VLPTGALLLNDNVHVSLDYCTFSTNEADWTSGGTMYAHDKVTLVVNNSLLNDSTAA